MKPLSRLLPFRPFLMLALLPCLGTPGASAATWQGSSNSNWSRAANWSAGEIPDGSFATATFGNATATNVNVNGTYSVGDLIFNAGANAYKLRLNSSFEDVFTIYGTVVNNSFNTQTITINSWTELHFAGSASAGNLTIANNGQGYGNKVHFQDSSMAGTAKIINGDFGELRFSGTSQAVFASADHSTISNSNDVIFEGFSSAGSAKITNEFTLQFLDQSTAADSEITNNYDLIFDGSSSAGNATIYVAEISTIYFRGLSSTVFSSADHAVITNDYNVYFEGFSSAGDSTITNHFELDFFGNAKGGNAVITNESDLYFHELADAQNATIINADYYAYTVFEGNSTAGNATLTGNEGMFAFTGESTAGNAAVRIDANAHFDISGLDSDGLTAGSIAGEGTFWIGSKNLEVGSLGADTEVSGSISDGGDHGGEGGSLTKVGEGKLTLSNGNDYSGGTVVKEGILQVDGYVGTGAGPVAVEEGATLTGGGTIAGATTVAGILAPGNSPGVLTFLDNVTLESSATLQIEIGGSKAGDDHDQLVVDGHLTLGGELQIVLVNGFLASLGDEFQILTFGGVSGDFDTYLLPELGNGLGWNTSQLLETGTVSVEAVPEPSTLAFAAGGAFLFFLLRRKARLRTAACPCGEA